jgi:hypothetical protein
MVELSKHKKIGTNCNQTSTGIFIWRNLEIHCAKKLAFGVHPIIF